jgi:phosphoglycerate kinase
VARVLGELLGRSVGFVGACIGGEVRQAVADAAPGSVVLLENLRFDPGETANDSDFAAELAAPFSHYVNDAFGTAHRAHASVDAAARRFPPERRAAGRLMQMEVDAITCLMTRPETPFVAVVGGAKISTKTAPLRALLERVQVLALGGGMATTFLLAEGREVGRSLVEAEMVGAAKEILGEARRRGVEILLPEDVVVTDSVDEPAEVLVVSAGQVPEDAAIVDIGPSARERYAQALDGARSAFWNGPMGVFEDERFAHGTTAVAEALAACQGFTVVGGGESVMAVRRAGVADRISHVSTGGGASLALISGDPMPGLRALESAGSEEA